MLLGPTEKLALVLEHRGHFHNPERTVFSTNTYEGIGYKDTDVSQRNWQKTNFAKLEVQAVPPDQDRDRSDKGTYAEEVSPDEALAVFTDREPLTATEVADELGVVRRTAFNKLTALEERGEIRKKKVGSKAVVWWRPD